MRPNPLKIFVGSVQQEFKQIRLDLKAFLLGDAVLRRFISEVFLFEEIPAKDRRANQVYLEAVERCDIYIGLFGYDYGYEDQNGVSPTEHEYNYATKLGKTRLIYVWGSHEKLRNPKMRLLISRVGNELIRRRVQDISALTAEVYASIVDYLDDRGALRILPFDATICENASLQTLSRKRIAWFMETARRERGFPLKPNTATRALLTHLNLIGQGKPTNAAILLFGAAPQQFHQTAETKCIHCHGTEYRRPFGSLQVYGGDIFAQADLARDFVLAKVNRSIGTRSGGITAPAVYDLPPDAVAEAIVNAIVHRDYFSNASVEVRLFSDRLEIWNPGSLPSTLTFESLRTDHPSVPNNPLVAESFYLARYIERVGSGTQTMIELCRAASLPEPQFEQRGGSFVVTLWRDWLTREFLLSHHLNKRQLEAVNHVKRTGKIANSDYQDLMGVAKRTAHRDLSDLVEKGIFEKVGARGKGTFYRLRLFGP